MKKYFAIILFFSFNQAFAQLSPADSSRLESLIKKMTLEEKIGQLNQYTGNIFGDTPILTAAFKKEDIIHGRVGAMLNVKGVKNTRTLHEDIIHGRVGAMLNVKGVKNTRTLQEMAMQSRLKIPLLFGLDVLHGLHLIFPIPLAEASSWDLKAIERSARISATETAAYGDPWVFSPMVDIARDPRWGRVMEGAGEDPYLGSLIATARVRGFQGKKIGDTDAVMATAKHFAAYGAAIGGRDYNSVDMSLPELWNIYLPPFKAAAEAGASSFMNSFNSLNGVPTTGSKYLVRDILKGDWKFKGFVVSDWGSVADMIAHGYSKDAYHAAFDA